MKICEAKIFLKWDNGKSQEVGTMTIEADKGQMKSKTSHFQQRIGWEFIRIGFGLMLPGRKWRIGE